MRAPIEPVCLWSSDEEEQEETQAMRNIQAFRERQHSDELEVIDLTCFEEPEGYKELYEKMCRQCEAMELDIQNLMTENQHLVSTLNEIRRLVHFSVTMNY